MKKMIYAAAMAAVLCGGLAACKGGLTGSPQSVASTTLLDEKAVTTANISYTAVSKLGEIAVKAGKLDKATFKDLDNRAYSADKAARAAYAAGNAADYATAIAQVNQAVVDMTTAVAK